MLSPVGKLTLTPTFQHPFKTPEDSTEPYFTTITYGNTLLKINSKVKKIL
ncbi:MAG TPA: hypothetical protein VE307_08465 [Nitrososphaeraceae archaeon]|nr:hypothetical protein [Nitrososphaeraceae archaeon]